jgi:hypothetical protein
VPDTPQGPDVADFLTLSPVRGLFFSAEPPPTLDLGLEPGFRWTLMVDDHRTLIASWTKHFNEALIPVEATSWPYSPTILIGAGRASSPEEAFAAFDPKIQYFLIAAALHTPASLRTRAFIFRRGENEIEEPVAGGEMIRTMSLPGPGDVQVDADTIALIAAAFPNVIRAFAARLEHPFRRAIGMFRAAVLAPNVEPTCILLCAALECLGSFANKNIPAQLCLRLVDRYAADPAADRITLWNLYDLRSVYVHGRSYVRWPTLDDRLGVLREGMLLTKHLLVEALGDDRFHQAAESGKKAHRAYLDQ